MATFSESPFLDDEPSVLELKKISKQLVQIGLRSNCRALTYGRECCITMYLKDLTVNRPIKNILTQAFPRIETNF